MSRPEKCLAQIAEVARTTLRANSGTGRGYAFYPARAVNDYPTLLLFWDETSVEYAAGKQHWIIQVKGQLMVSKKGDTLSSDIARADPLLVPLVDAFAPETVNYHLESTDPNTSVAFCRIERVQPSLVINFGGVDHYAAQLFYRLKMLRGAGQA